MDHTRVVAGLNVHKDSIYLCITSHTGDIFLKKLMVWAPRSQDKCHSMVMLINLLRDSFVVKEEVKMINF